MSSLRTKRFRLRLRQYRPFLIIVAFTAAIWFVMAMSEHHTYPARVQITWTGFDTARYVVASADTVLPLFVVSNGWQELDRSHKAHRGRHCLLQTVADTSIAVADLYDEIAEQMRYHALHGMSSPVDSLRLRLTERCSKAFVPDISGVSFSFAHHVGIGGAPRLEPDTVYLYGSAVSLARVSSLKVASAAIANINDSDSYLLDLEPVWENYPDLRPSTKQVRLVLPTETFTEKQFVVSVRLLAADTTLQVRLYPETVKLTLLVSKKDYPRLSADHIEVVADLLDTRSSVLHPRVSRFPSYARVKQVEPAELQYVIIKK